jgi:cellulose synthase/poly-beta-1,6-N-acetylglucosamine synthase-like glycosyltransferase
MRFLPDFEINFSFFLFIFFCANVFIHFVYILFFFSRLLFFKIKHPKEEIISKLPPVSIIIAARNESDNLFNNLPFILEQDYPEFEVIVVNHQSIDESYHILNAYKMKYPNLKVVEIEKSKHIRIGKKLPITLGVKSAKFEHLLLTDADCKPNTSKWILQMSTSFVYQKDLVLGFSPYYTDQTFLNKIIRFDTTFIAVNYFSFALAKVPYMGVGRNIAYTKSLFKSVNGFKSHYAISSGDDDLFVQEVSAKADIGLVIHEDAFMITEPKSSFSEWVLQKTRHFTTSTKYSVIKKILLGIYPSTMIFTLISFVYLVFDLDYSIIILAMLVFLFLVKWLILGLSFRKLRQNELIKWIPVLDLVYTFLMPVIFYTSDFKSDKWK